MFTRQIIIGCVVTLMLVGLVMVYSVTAVSCGVRFTENSFVVRQAVWMALALAAMALFARLDYHRLAAHSRIILILTLVALAALLVLGPKVNGARRWFRIGPASLQISEFAKIAVILYLADFVCRKHELLHDFWRGFIPPAVAFSLTCALILLEPDFGTAVLVGLVALTLLLAAGVRKRHIAPFAALAVVILALLIIIAPYRLRRLLAFVNPWADPQGDGYHIVQSLIALGSGGLIGVGPGRGLQKLGFLPEAESDFIFAIFGQETGFAGCVLLILVFVALFYAGLSVARRAPDVLGELLALGVTILIGFQMLINVGVAASAVPTKGLALPFVSLGGSSIIALSAGIGMLLNVARHCTVAVVPLHLGARPRESPL